MASLVDDLLRTVVRGGSGIAEWEALALPVFDRLKVSVLIPALNEQECLPYVLPRLPDWVDEVIRRPFDGQHGASRTKRSSGYSDHLSGGAREGGCFAVGRCHGDRGYTRHAGC